MLQQALNLCAQIRLSGEIGGTVYEVISRLKKDAKDNGFLNPVFFMDDGVLEATFDRPDF